MHTKTQKIELVEEDREIVINALDAYAKFRGNPRGDTAAALAARRVASRAIDLAARIRLDTPA